MVQGYREIDEDPQPSYPVVGARTPPLPHHPHTHTHFFDPLQLCVTAAVLVFVMNVGSIFDIIIIFHY